MSLLDGILGQVAGGAMGQAAVAGIAEKFGIPPAMAETAVAALTAAHAQPGDTVSAAADSTGIDPQTMQQIHDHLGGEGGLASIASQVAQNPAALQAITGMLGGAGGQGGAGGMLGSLLGGLMGGKAQ